MWKKSGLRSLHHGRKKRASRIGPVSSRQQISCRGTKLTASRFFTVEFDTQKHIAHASKVFVELGAVNPCDCLQNISKSYEDFHQRSMPVS